MAAQPKPVTLRPRARADLEDIWDYTAEIWSPEQAERYTDLVINSFETIAAAPLRGVDVGEVRDGYRRWSIGRHYVFYRETSETIEIVRILHQVRDHTRHL